MARRFGRTALVSTLLAGTAVLLLLQGCFAHQQPKQVTGVQESAKAKPSPKMLRGVASYYSDSLNGEKTANEERYDRNALTAAHRTLPFNSRLRVRNVENGKSVVVRINDRGPFVKGRILDLSFRAAKQLGFSEDGLATVEAEVLQ